MIDAALKDWATDKERQYLEALEKGVSIRQLAKDMGVTRSTVQSALKQVKLRAARKGYAPTQDLTHTVPEGFQVKGFSSYYNAEGKLTGQWLKASADEDKREEMLRAMVEGMAAEIPRAAPTPVGAHGVSPLLNLYTITDYHLGMLACEREGGADWDMAIAEGTLRDIFSTMVRNAPPASTGFVNFLGDLMHSDGLVPVTPSSGHVLDQDARFSKLVQVCIKLIRGVVAEALRYHGKVVLLIAEGNHDMASSVWLRALFKALYELEPRVTVIESDLPYYAYQHGQTMLGFHHGHLKKNDGLPLLFASQFPQMWGVTTKRYAHTGHRHHVEEKEHSGMMVTQHSTLAARDAYAARGGWYSERQATVITYHERYGQVSRTVFTPEMLL